MEMLNASLEQLIAASEGGLLGTGDSPNELDLSDIASTEAVSGNLSRRSVWEDDDFDDEDF